jgi:FixJ family two-component response regulator
LPRQALHKSRVLVVDDEKSLTALVAMLLEHNGGCIGGLRFLAKPFRSDELMDCIAQQLAE